VIVERAFRQPPDEADGPNSREKAEQKEENISRNDARAQRLRPRADKFTEHHKGLLRLFAAIPS